MENILTMNQTMFGKKFIERRVSKRSRKAQVAEFTFSSDIVEMTYDECDVVDGGGKVAVYLQCSLGAIIASFGVGFTTGFIMSYLTMKIGKSLPTWVGKLAGAVVGATIGAVISSQINKNTDIIKIPLLVTWIPFVKFEKTIDLGDKAYDLVSTIGGGFGGGAGGYAAGFATGSLVGVIA